MARTILPQDIGSTIDLRCARGATVKVTAPDGLVLLIPAPNGRVSVWLPQEGTWTYEWSDGEHVTRGDLRVQGGQRAKGTQAGARESGEPRLTGRWT